MTEAARRVRQLEEFVLTRRALSTLSEEREDAILEEMDELWLQMTEEERKEINRRARDRVTVEAPDKLGLRDRAMQRGSREPPRMVA